MEKIFRLRKLFKNPAINATFAAMALAGCVSRPVISPDQTFHLQLKAIPKEISKSLYHSDSKTADFQNQQKVREREEIVDFQVSNEILAASAKSFVVRTTTTSKDGLADLHDFAFPEKDESIDFEYSYSGDVLKAGSYSPKSLFFVPPISLPDQAVRVGDTWALEHTWLSNGQGLPLHLSMVTIFKNVVRCEPFGLCADLELSGAVIADDMEMHPVTNYKSRIWGRLLLSIDRGDVIWSEVRSRETIKNPQAETDVVSCMGSIMQEMRLPDKTLKSELKSASCRPVAASVDPINL